MTLVKRQYSGGGQTLSVELWALANPTTAIGSVTLTLSSVLDSVATSISFEGVKQVVSNEGVTGANGTGGDATVNITTVSDTSWVIDGVVTGDTAITVGPGQVQRSNVSGSLGSAGMSTEGPITPAGTVTMSWTDIGLQPWAIASMYIKPA